MAGFRNKLMFQTTFGSNTLRALPNTTKMKLSILISNLILKTYFDEPNKNFIKFKHINRPTSYRPF